MVEVTSPVRGSRDCPPVRAMCTRKPRGGEGDEGSAHNDEQDAAVGTKSERLSCSTSSLPRWPCSSFPRSLAQEKAVESFLLESPKRSPNKMNPVP